MSAVHLKGLFLKKYIHLLILKKRVLLNVLEFLLGAYDNGNLESICILKERFDLLNILGCAIKKDIPCLDVGVDVCIGHLFELGF